MARLKIGVDLLEGVIEMARVKGVQNGIIQ
jgi:hypothetical protein